MRKIKAISQQIRNYSGENPFRDGQARNFTDEKVLAEFQPTSKYWSLFNGQHEILTGTRGSGKTIIFKMMRYSLLKKLDHDKARAIIFNKSYIGVYVAMNLEFVNRVPLELRSTAAGTNYFQFAFNCMLIDSFLFELQSLLEDQFEDWTERCIAEENLTTAINDVWKIPCIGNTEGSIFTLQKLRFSIRSIYYNSQPSTQELSAPNILKTPLITPIKAIVDIIIEHLKLNGNQTWILCIDEAEFLPESFQRCVNSILRSDSSKIVVKMATLPFKHLTRETLLDGVYCEPDGNDFNYQSIDMLHNDSDFVKLCDSICKARFSQYARELEAPQTLSAFLGSVGEDDQIDYFRFEWGEEKATRQYIENNIIQQMKPDQWPNRRGQVIDQSIPKKQLYDKYGPIYFLREAKKLYQKGAHVPGWYAGAKMTRKIAQGNPRRLIQLLNILFESARSGSLTPKAQCKAILTYAFENTAATIALPIFGRLAAHNLNIISETLEARTHGGAITDSGNTFQIDASENYNFEWLKLAVQYLRITVDDASLRNGFSKESKFSLSNTYSALHFIPMRIGGYPRFLAKEDGGLLVPSGTVISPDRIGNSHSSLFSSLEIN